MESPTADDAVLVIRAWLEPNDPVRVRARLLGLTDDGSTGVVLQGAEQVLDAVRHWLDDLVSDARAD
jgi:hypothetical protein